MTTATAIGELTAAHIGQHITVSGHHGRLETTSHTRYHGTSISVLLDDGRWYARALPPTTTCACPDGEGDR